MLALFCRLKKPKFEKLLVQGHTASEWTGGLAPWSIWFQNPYFHSTTLTKRSRQTQTCSWFDHHFPGGTFPDPLYQSVLFLPYMHSNYPPALAFMAPNIIVILPLFMWFCEWLSFSLDCKVYARSKQSLLTHSRSSLNEWMNEWVSHCFKLTFAVIQHKIHSQENPNCYHCLIVLARSDNNHKLDSNYVFHLNISKQDKNKQLEIANKKKKQKKKERERETKISLELCQRSWW